MGYEWLALAAASLWAVAALISVKPARHLGAFAYSRWRMFLVSLMLGSSASLVTRGLADPHRQSALPLLALSGLIGIFVGDTALYRLHEPAWPQAQWLAVLLLMRSSPPCSGSGCSANN